MAVRPSTNAFTTQSTRPDDISSMTSSRDLSDLIVALGAKRRAMASLAEPTSTAMLTSGLLMSAQVLASSPFLSMAPNGCGKIHDKRTLWGRIEGKAEVDLVRLQVEDQISVSRLGIFKFDVEKLRDIVGHLDREAGPVAGSKVLVEVRQLSRQYRDAERFVGADAIERVVRGCLCRCRACDGGSKRCAAADGKGVAQRFSAIFGNLTVLGLDHGGPPAPIRPSLARASRRSNSMRVIPATVEVIE